jgi:hypothetical protein
MEPMPGQKTLSQKDIEQMLDRMRDMARTGSRDAARQTLDQLRQMLDNLRAGRPSIATREQMEQARRASDALQAITKEQQELLDQTYRAQQEGTQKGQPDEAGSGKQQALRHKLGDAMQMLGDLGADIPDALGEAEQSMRDAEGALGKGDLPGAVQAQTHALDKLREGSQQANQSLAAKMGGGQLARMPGQPQGRSDPLGRELEQDGDENGTNENGTTKIPAEADLQKSREVLDELRRRSGDGHRSRAERDYLERLLKQMF